MDIIDVVAQHNNVSVIMYVENYTAYSHNSIGLNYKSSLLINIG